MAKEEETPSPATDGKGSDSAEPAAESQDSGTTPRKSNSTDALIGGAVWLVIGLVVAFIWLRGNVADVYVDVSPKDAREISGVVSYKGRPVASGHVALETRDPHGKLLGSCVFEVGGDGRFRVDPAQMPEALAGAQPFTVVATFDGSLPDPGGDAAKSKALSGSKSVYLNQSPPPDFGWWIGVAALGLSYSLLLVMLFTMSPSEQSARWLFRLTYIFILLALFLPIAVIGVMSQSDHVVHALEQTPVGLVKGRSVAVTKAQWIVNIGGAVLPHAPAPPAAGTGSATAGDDLPYIEGGLAVPFFVLILAILGGAINMTMKVPAIQQKYQAALLPQTKGSILEAVARSPMILFGANSATERPSPKQIEIASGLRRALLSQYMFLVSAPFLAIAVYYLMQVVARQVEEPVLVLMAFATGIVSDKIVNGISEFAEGVLQSLRRGRGGADKTEEPKVAAGEAATKI